jgi:hypothetical protein
METKGLATVAHVGKDEEGVIELLVSCQGLEFPREEELSGIISESAMMCRNRS